MAQAESPTRDDQAACLHERTLVSVVANMAAAPFFLIPFTALVTILTRRDNDGTRLQAWMGAAIVSTVLIAVGVNAYRRLPSATIDEPAICPLLAGS